MLSTYSRSPYRDRQNRINLGNTPTRIHKPSLSPLRSRRTQSSMVSRSTLRRRQQEPQSLACINDQKPAKYMIQSEDESLYYCEKCAILLASKGFSVEKLVSSQSTVDNDPRRDQVQAFLAELDTVMGSLCQRQTRVAGSVGRLESALREEEARIEDYYSQFFEIIEEHKRRVLEELREQFQSVAQGSKEQGARVETAIAESKSMKKDIVESMDIILYESEEHTYRPIMDNYQVKLRDYRSMINQPIQAPKEMRRLTFRDAQQACNALEEGLQMQWQGEPMESSRQSECPQNPVEVINNQEHFPKSSLKDMGNLFSSFDE